MGESQDGERGQVHVGIPVGQRRMEGVWECAENCPHPDHDDDDYGGESHG